MPAWAVDMLDRNVHNIQIVNQAQLEIGRGETDDVLPSEVTDVYSLVTITMPPAEEGDVEQTWYRTCKQSINEGRRKDSICRYSDCAVTVRAFGCSAAACTSC